MPIQQIRECDIQRSGHEWQLLRQRKAERARQAGLSTATNPERGLCLADSQSIITFIPGNPTPLTSTQRRNGDIIPVNHPIASSSQPPRRRRRQAVPHAPPPPPRNSNVIRRSFAAEDAALLARLASPRTVVKRKGQTLEGPEKKKSKLA
ncbi:hypothetical protein B0H15DRAFT_804802 [Mycena belliarum]|uniref:Uncharacterized protein n=1 Tax=Mycena belliarum TaxID=1033014 RepID=A0AAD6XPF9_9AGAR|nr:hypothetical protein B0H15DRAFT_804802 [Mycena belliae]